MQYTYTILEISILKMINEDPKGALTHDTHYMTHHMMHIT